MARSEPTIATVSFRSPADRPTAPLGLALDRVSRAVWLVLHVVAGVALLALLVTIVADVVGRYLLGSGIAGGTDMVSKWWMVLLVFSGIAIAQHAEGRIQVDFLMDALPLGMRRIADTVVLLLVAATDLALGWFALQEALHQMAVGEFVPIGHRLIWPFRFIVPVGFAAFAFACALSIVRIWRVGYPDPDALPPDPTAEGRAEVI